jgi:hypothetical protein
MPDKVDFCSSAWVDEAERVLNALVAEAGDAIAGQRISVCETFTDPPARLGPEAVWSFAIDDGAVVVTRGALPEADVQVRADYKAALPRARTVYDTSPEAAAKRRQARRDAAAAAGGAPKGPFDAVSPALMGLLTELHNRMARVTA